MSVGVIALIFASFLWFNLYPFVSLRSPLPQKMVLEVDLSKPIYEQSSPSLLTRQLRGAGTSFYHLMEKLYRAGDDPRVGSLIVKIGYEGLGLSQIQEIRQALHHLRGRGKLTYAHGETFEGSGGTKLYYLASACDQITLQPIGSLGLTGLALEVPFGRGALDKWGIKPQFEKREEYKTFAESFTETQFTPAHKESLQTLLDDLFQQVLEDVAKDRRLSPSQVTQLSQEGPYTSEEALTHGLVDHQGFLDEVRTQALEKGGKGSVLVPIHRYTLEPVAKKDQRIFKIALVHANGMIQNDGGGEMGQAVLSSRRLQKIFKQIREDKKVHGVVLRIDTGGGSASASEAIWREIARFQESGIPVIISMGNTTASGGYLLSASAHRLFAQPGTITGSIGVISGKFVTEGAWEQVGVKWGTLSTSPRALMWSTSREFSPEEKKRLSEVTQAVYDRFVTIVAEGRRIPKDQVLKIAKGRVWTGRQGKEHGLIDELGGLQEALTYAKKQISGVDPSQVVVEEFPRVKTPLEQLLGLMGYLNTEEDEGLSLEMGDWGAWAFQEMVRGMTQEFLSTFQKVHLS
jgi:protease-4